jgi:hypothetical protein
MLRSSGVLGRDSLRRLLLGVLGVAMLSAAPTARALDSTAYAVIAPTYLPAAGAESYIRFINPSTSASTFTVTIAGTPSGATYATKTYQIPAKAALQKALTVLLSESAVGPLAGGDVGYSLYLQNPNPIAGYQHVTYNGTTALFGNQSNCKFTLNQAMGASSNTIVLNSVHTSTLANNGFPSSVVIHNARPVAANYQVVVVEEVSGTTICPPGKTLSNSTCALSVEIAANATRGMDFKTFFETNLGWTPPDQARANLYITDPGINTPPSAVVTHVVRNTNPSVFGAVDLSAACAVNPVVVAASTVSTTATSYFDATIAGSGGASGALAITIQPSSASTAASLTVEKSAAVERQQATLTASGTLQLSGSSASITLTGTYNSSTNTLTLSGGGYSFTGSVIGGSSITGTYTGPGSTTGGFSGVSGSATVKATTYCGSYGGSDDAGSFTLSVNASGSGIGTAKSTRYPTDPPTSLSVQVSGSTLNGTTDGGGRFSGPISATALSGSFLTSDGFTGTYSGTACSAR